jgi:pyruvate/2-oxoglutarate dehydrogenase complex dihydrolipoamide acyltransferase (E2) component
MITEIRVPKLGMTQADITVVELRKKDGERVDKDEIVAVIETAKVTYELKASASGMIFNLKKVKDRVNIGDILAVVADRREEFDEYMAGLSQEPEEEGIGLAFDEEEEGGVSLSFEEEEEEAVIEFPPVDLGDRKVKERIPFIGMRRTIADNLVSSLQTGAQLTIVSETDMTELSEFRKILVLDYPETKITFVDMLVKILAFALKEYPIINSTVIGDEIICWDEYHLGVAMALDKGLVVPVVKDVDKKSLVQVSREIKKLAKKARNNELEPAHYQGGTFTLTSGGRVETDIITPIINPPQNAILAIGKVAPRPAVYEGQLAIRTTAYLCLTHDHRVIDGVPASLFLGRLKECIESPDIFKKILS